MVLSLETLQKPRLKVVVKNKQSERDARLQRAEEIGDYLEFAADDLNEEEYLNLLQQLVMIAAEEEDDEIKEVELNAVATALSLKKVGQPLDLTALVAQSDHLTEDCLLHAIDIMGFAGNESCLPVIEGLLEHSDAEVRETVAIALKEIRD